MRRDAQSDQSSPVLADQGDLPKIQRRDAGPEMLFFKPRVAGDTRPETLFLKPKLRSARSSSMPLFLKPKVGDRDAGPEMMLLKPRLGRGRKPGKYEFD